MKSNKEGIECPHCKTWNLHEECGTYQVLFPECKNCGGCTEVPPNVDMSNLPDLKIF